MQDCSGNFLIVPESDHCRRRSETDLTLLPLSESRRRSSSLRNLIQSFNTKADEHDENQRLNPFSDRFDKTYRPKLSAEEYGRPKAGSKSQARGVEAEAKSFEDTRELCEYINMYGQDVKRAYLGIPADAKKVIKFGTLFMFYSTVTGSLNGGLKKARKDGLVAFDGEVLFQGVSDDEDIYLLKTIQEIRDFCNGQAMEIRRSITPQPF